MNAKTKAFVTDKPMFFSDEDTAYMERMRQELLRHSPVRTYAQMTAQEKQVILTRLQGRVGLHKTMTKVRRWNMVRPASQREG